MTEKDEFPIIERNGWRAISHCGWCQPATNPEIKARLDKMREETNLEITTGICKVCEEELDEEEES